MKINTLCALALSILCSCSSMRSARIETSTPSPGSARNRANVSPGSLDGRPASIETGAHSLGFTRDRASVSFGSLDGRSRLVLGAERMAFEDGSHAPALRVGIEYGINTGERFRPFVLGSLGASIEPDLGLGIGAEYRIGSRVSLRVTVEQYFADYGSEIVGFAGLAVSL